MSLMSMTFHEEPRWESIPAVFGGTFDPPHLGHQEATLGLLQEPGVSQVIVLPSRVPPLKDETAASAEARTEMCRLNFLEGIKGSSSKEKPIQLDLREINRPATEPSYTENILGELQKEKGEIAFVIGSDQLRQFDRWHGFPDILSLSHWIVLERKGEPAAHPVLEQWQSRGLLHRERSAQNLWKVQQGKTFIKQVSTPARALSSRSIRQKIRQEGKIPADCLDPAVEDYLKTHRIYDKEKSL